MPSHEPFHSVEEADRQTPTGHARREWTRFFVVFGLTFLAILAVLRLGVVQRIAYEIERGRLQAQQEALLDAEQARAAGQPPASAASTTRQVAELVAPAVVSIVTELPSVGRRQQMADTDAARLDADHPATRPANDEAQGENRRPLAGFASDGQDADQAPPIRGVGSGFIFNADEGYVVTNAHVVRGAKQILVVLADGREAQATLLGADGDSDLAVLRIGLGRLHALTFGDSDAMAIGDDVLAVGNPFGLEGTFSKGIISAPVRDEVVLGSGAFGLRGGGFLQTDAAINPGNSGGPLVNMCGEVIGINAAILSTTGRYAGVGFATPSNRVRPMLGDLVDGGPGFLGVEIDRLTPTVAKRLGWSGGGGVWIRGVMAGLAAQQAGIEPDDVLVELDGSLIKDETALDEEMAEHAPEEMVQVKLWRNGGFTILDLTLGRRYAPAALRAKMNYADEK